MSSFTLQWSELEFFAYISFQYEINRSITETAFSIVENDSSDDIDLSLVESSSGFNARIQSCGHGTHFPPGEP
jgi:hypothetical protein